MAEDFSDRTQTFSIETPQKLDMQQVLVQVYDALKEKGYQYCEGKVKSTSNRRVK